MAYFDPRSVGVFAVILGFAGCTANPFFHVESDSGPDGSTGDGSTVGMSSQAASEPPTTGEPTSGEGDAGGTTQIGGETGVSGTTTGAPDTGSSEADVDTGPVDTGPVDTGVPGVCGDGEIDPGEACDDGPNNADQGDCRTDCQMAACGDGFLHAVDEQCDDGNQVDTDACTAACKHAVCGDGILEAGVEACDDGANNSKLGQCTETCEKTFCGDGVQQNGEACDDGLFNGSGVGKCGPDCGAVVQQKLKIRLSGTGLQGDLQYMGFEGIEGADKLCAVFGSYKAMIADGDARIASNNPWEGKVAGWVLKPHTAYVDDLGALIGVTGAEGLLGVQSVPKGKLVNPIASAGGLAWTGMADDWTSEVPNCEGWSSNAGDKKGTVGNGQDKVDMYLHFDGQEAVCGESRRVYCAQQSG